VNITVVSRPQMPQVTALPVSNMFSPYRKSASCTGLMRLGGADIVTRCTI